MKFDVIAQEWFHSKVGFVKDSTLSAYYQQLRSHILPYWKDMDVESFKKNDAQLFIGQKFQEGLSMKTVKDLEITLKQILLYAVDEHDMNVPTAFKLKYPTANLVSKKEELQIYSPDEQRRIVQYFREHPSYRTLGVVIVICTGLRIGEICGLRWSDISLENNMLQVNRTVERIVDYSTGKTKVVIQPPKTINSQRSVPFPSWLADILISFAAPCRSDYYVISGSDKLIEPRTYRNYYRNLLLNKIGLSRCIKFHGLRHTYASTLITNGADVKTVSTMLGHSTVSTTLDIYTHSTLESRRKCAETILMK